MRKFLANTIALGVLAETSRRARSQRVNAIEESIFRRFNDAPDDIHPPVWAIMQMGSLAAVFVAAGHLSLQRRPIHATVTALVGTSVWAGVKAIKPSIGRGRPEHHLDSVKVRGPAQTGLGFPSGHSAVSLTLALAVTHSKSPRARLAAISAAGVTGCARMYVGAHLPLDIAGGFAIGALCGQASRSIIARTNKASPAV